MTHLTQKRIVSFGIAAALVASLASPVFAKLPPASAPYGDYNKFKGCTTDEGYGRSLPCEAGAAS